MQPALAHVHVASPSQFTVHPPSAHVTAQVVLPVQSSVDPGCSVTAHVLPPPHFTVEPAPAVTVQELWPAQLAIDPAPRLCTHVLFASHCTSQLLPHAPLQLESLAQCEVQFWPQVTSHVLLFWQSNVTSDGAFVVPASLPPPPPSTQLPPASHAQPVVVQAHAPVHAGGLFFPQDDSASRAPSASVLS